MMIYFETDMIQLRDIPNVLKRMGYATECVNMGIRAQQFEQESCDRVKAVLREKQADYAITYNFIETVSQACMEEEVPYISWVYDNPQQELYGRRAQYPCNYIFVFDKRQEERLRQIGLKRVYHMPLAIDGEKVQRALGQSEYYAGKYEAEIAFVGQLYKIEGLERIIEHAGEEVRNAVEESLEGCFMQWRSGAGLHGRLKDEAVQYLGAIEGHKLFRESPYMTEQYYYEAAVSCRLLANRERLAVLNTLAKKHQVRLYTFDERVQGLDERVEVFPGVTYEQEAANVYRQSKINLNITLHCIETGLSQRVFDVLSAGGFLLSNYQSEMEELFVPGEDVVLYHDMEELCRLAEYYLEHEEERSRIAKNGQRKALKYHDYAERLKRVIQLVEKEEKERRHSYAKLFRCREQELFMLESLVSCRNAEIRLGQERLFAEMADADSVRDKYLRAWQLLRQLTGQSDAGLYGEAGRLLANKQISPLYPVWQIYHGSKGHDGGCDTILLKLSDGIWKEHPAYAIELLAYGVLLSEEETRLLLKRAEYLMELQLWEEALKVLRQISPQKEAAVSETKVQEATTPRVEVEELIRVLEGLVH